MEIEASEDEDMAPDSELASSSTAAPAVPQEDKQAQGSAAASSALTSVGLRAVVRLGPPDPDGPAG